MERDFITLMLLESAVTNIEDQPVEIRYVHEAKRRAYIPDFLVKISCQSPRLVEIKYQNELQLKAKEFKPKFEAAANYAKERGWKFEVWTEVEIRTPRFANADLLLPFKRHPPDAGMAARIINHLNRTATASDSVESILCACFPDDAERDRGRHALWALIAHRKLSADLNTALDQTSIVSCQIGRANA